MKRQTTRHVSTGKNLKSKLIACYQTMLRFKARELQLNELRYVQRLSFSQFGEDVFLDQFFGKRHKPGFFVDVGAYHPFTFSNTYFFLQKTVARHQH